MFNLTAQPGDQRRPDAFDPASPKPEDEGLSWRQIQLIPIIVPLAAVMLALCASAVMTAAL